MKHKTLIALAVASLFAAPAVYAASSLEKTSDRSVIAMTEDAYPDQQEDNADLIRLPKSVIAATEDAIPDQQEENADLIRLPKSVIAEGLAVSMLSIMIFPSELRSRCPIMFKRVVFPHPEGPMIAIMSPFRTARSNPRMA